MAQIKFICLANPIMWQENVKSPEEVKQKLLTLRKTSKSWIKVRDDRGSRSGIYKIEKLVDDNIILLRFITEGEVKEEFESIEKILDVDKCLPKGIDIPKPIPKAKKAFLYFNFEEGLCYVFARNPTDTDSLFNLLENLIEDVGLFVDEPKIFEWQQEFHVKITEVAYSRGYKAYKTQAILDNVTVTAEGDLEGNEDFEKVKRSIDIGKWKTLAYRKSDKDSQSIFWISKTRTKQISIELDFLPVDELYEKIKEMRIMVEKALGYDIRKNCYPFHQPALDSFYKNAE